MKLAAGAALALALTPAVGGCGQAQERGELTVAAASSLNEAFRAYGAERAGGESFSFAGSDALAAQIRTGARPDVYAAAGTSLPRDLFAQGLAGEPVVFARNELVLAVPAGSPLLGPPSSIRDVFSRLADSGQALVIGAPGAPVGDYAREAIGRLPAADAEAILALVRSEEPDAKGIVAKLLSGGAGAGLVYATDVRAAGGRLEAVRLPARLRPQVTYAAAVVGSSAVPGQAEEFVEGLLTGPGARELRAAGFGAP